MQSQRKRSLLKTLTWRILATSDTFLISYLITGRFDFAGAIAGIEVITKMFLYYMVVLMNNTRTYFLISTK